MEISPNYLDRFQVKPPSKNEERKRLIDKLSETSGWTKKSIHFQTLHFPDSWLKDALEHCLHFSNPKARNAKLKEFITNCKSELNS